MSTNYTIMKLLALFSLIFISLKSTGSSKLLGTPSRLENEYKITITESNAHDYYVLIKSVEKTLSSLFPLEKTKTYFYKSELKNKVNEKSLHFNSNRQKLSILAKKQLGKRKFINRDFLFASYLKKNYHLQAMQEIRLFVDEYYDTSDKKLLNNNVFYRLRRRWKNYESYLFSFFNKPLRVEIQTKEYINSSDYLTAWDTRLEFNHLPESETEISQNLDLIYLKTIQSGFYKNQPIWPFQRLQLPSTEELGPIITLKSFRKRFHILNSNPWGSGQNPDHVFLVTVDRVHAECIKISPCDKKNNIIEIEIELERNISKNLELILNSKPKKTDQLLIATQKSTEIAKSFVMKDLELIYKRLLDAIHIAIPRKQIIKSKPKIRYYL